MGPGGLHSALYLVWPSLPLAEEDKTNSGEGGREGGTKYKVEKIYEDENDVHRFKTL